MQAQAIELSQPEQAEPPHNAKETPDYKLAAQLLRDLQTLEQTIYDHLNTLAALRPEAGAAVDLYHAKLLCLHTAVYHPGGLEAAARVRDLTPLTDEYKRVIVCLILLEDEIVRQFPS